MRPGIKKHSEAGGFVFSFEQGRGKPKAIPYRSYLINLDYVTGLNTSDQLVEFQNGDTAIYSQQLKDALVQRMKK